MPEEGAEPPLEVPAKVVAMTAAAPAAAPILDRRLQSGDDAEIEPVFYKPKMSRSLEQGDIVPRSSPIVQTVISEYHRYHVGRAENEMFAVVTQSCDLVRHGDSCKARYIALAPVRSLRQVLSREFKDVLVRTPGELYLLGSAETEGRYGDFLTKLINNNDSRHFFLPEDPSRGIAEDMCIMLPLALPIRVEHYDICAESRIAQLDDLFQAKLGWLLGQQYSRVATPDWPEAWLAKKVQAVSDRSLTWFPENDFQQVKTQISKLVEAEPGIAIGEEQFQKILKNIKNRKMLAIEKIIDLLDISLSGAPLPPPGQERYKLKKKLELDKELAKLFPNS